VSWRAELTAIAVVEGAAMWAVFAWALLTPTGRREPDPEGRGAGAGPPGWPHPASAWLPEQMRTSAHS
jgi:hypothetical protein